MEVFCGLAQRLSGRRLRGGAELSLFFRNVPTCSQTAACEWPLICKTPFIALHLSGARDWRKIPLPLGEMLANWEVLSWQLTSWNVITGLSKAVMEWYKLKFLTSHPSCSSALAVGLGFCRGDAGRCSQSLIPSVRLSWLNGNHSSV